MAINKVVFGQETLVDLSGDTVTSDKLIKGYTAHDKSGNKITGTHTDLDTSDATATAADIEKGKTAYVNGKKIEGNIAIYSASELSGNVTEDTLTENGVTKKSVRTTVTFGSDRIYRKGAVVYAESPCENFGDATIDDVVEGKTFTSAAGLKKKGVLSKVENGKWLLLEKGKVDMEIKHYVSPEDQIALYYPFTRDVAFLKGGIICLAADSSEFGDATAEYVEQGKTFTSPAGIKKAGNIYAYKSQITKRADSIALMDLSDEDDTRGLRFLFKFTEKCIIYKDCEFRIYTQRSNFGDATAADVAAGKTFTSTAGLKVTGTASGGLPATITAGDTPVAASWAGQKVSAKTATKTTLEISIKKAGTYRFKVAACSSGTMGIGTTNPTVAIYKNGSAVSGASGSVTSTTVECLSFDVACAANDVITVYGTAAGSTYSTTAVTCMSLVACINWDNGIGG